MADCQQSYLLVRSSGCWNEPVFVGALNLAASLVFAQTFSSEELNLENQNARPGTAQQVNSSGGKPTAVRPVEPARTLGNQSASSQSDSVRAVPYCLNGATNYPTCTFVTTGTENQTLACPSPQTGSISQERSVTYTNGVASSYGAWVTTAKNCVVPPLPSTCSNGASNFPTCTFPPSSTTTTQNQTIACPSPQTGSITQTRTVTTTNGVAAYGVWSTVSSTCVAPSSSSYSESQTLACPAPQTGNMFESRTVTVTNGVASYGPWMPGGNTCVMPPSCNAATNCEGVNNVTRNSCTSAILGVDWNSPACGFVNVTTSVENQTIPCGPGQTGNIYQSRLITYTNGSISSVGGWATGGDNCQLIPVVVPPPPDPFVVTAVFRCGVELARGWVPQSQAGNWYATVGDAAIAQWDSVNGGVCGVGL